jgi:hypothetical protein
MEEYGVNGSHKRSNGTNGETNGEERLDGVA